jgi:putative FmdB family regulatory protein
MPRYAYHCEKCSGSFEYYHSLSEKKTECEVCNEQTLLKVPSFSGIIKKEVQQKVGAIVDNYIEEARQEIRQEKEELKKVEYKPE